MARTLGDRLVRGSSWVLGGRLAASLGSFSASILIARWFAPETYGAYLVAVGLITLTATVGALGLEQTSVRLFAAAGAIGRSACLRVLLRRTFLLATAGTLITTIGFWYFRRFLIVQAFGLPDLLASAGLLALWLCATVFQRLISEIFKGLHDMRLATLFAEIRFGGLLSGILLPVGLVVMKVLGVTELQSLVLFMVASSWLLVAVGAIIMARHIGFAKLEESTELESPENPALDLSFTGILSIAMPLLLATLMVNARNSGDVLLLGVYSPISEVAVYGVAKRMIALVVIPVMALNTVLAPLAAALFASNRRATLEQTVRSISTLSSLFSALVFLGTVALGRAFLESAFGAFYGDAYGVLLILMIGQLANALTGPNALVLAMTGHEQSVMSGTTLATVLMLACGVPLARSHGGIGIAIAATLGQVAQNLLLIWRTRLKIGVWTHAFLSPAAFRAGLREIRSLAPKGLKRRPS